MDVAEIRQILGHPLWQDSAQAGSTNRLTEASQVVKKLTQVEVRALEGFNMFIPASPAVNEPILAEAVAGVPIQIGTNHGHDLYYFVKSPKGWSLAKYGAHAEFNVPSEPQQAVPVLINYTHSPLPWVRQQACFSLGQTGPEAQSAVPELLKLLNDPNQDVRVQATNALKSLGIGIVY